MALPASGPYGCEGHHVGHFLRKDSVLHRWSEESPCGLVVVLRVFSWPFLLNSVELFKGNYTDTGEQLSVC